MLHNSLFQTKVRRGYTLVEILIVLALMVLFGSVAGVSLFGRRNETDLDVATKRIVTLLREAQSRAVSQNSDTGWGVHFENGNPAYVVLYSNSGHATTSYYVLPAMVVYATSSLPSGNNREVDFNRPDGTVPNPTSIVLNLLHSPDHSVTITIGAQGTISY